MRRNTVNLSSSWLVFLFVATCFSQGRQNVVQTGFVDARNLAWQAPTSTFASSPSAANPGTVYVFTDAITAGVCTGGGAAKALCRSNGTGWDAIGGGGTGPTGPAGSPGAAGQGLDGASTTLPATCTVGHLYFKTDATAGQNIYECAATNVWTQQLNSGGGGGVTPDPSIFSSGTALQRFMQCNSGTVDYTSVAALGAVTNGEITIQTSVSGNVRYDYVQVSETTLFAGTFSGLTVSMGRPGSTNHSELTGGTVNLKQSGGDANFWNTRPAPPYISTGTYSIVLNFVSTGANLSAASGGRLTWEMCGYAAH